MSDSCVTPWTGVHQDPLFMGFSRQEYWNRLAFPSPGDLPDPMIKLESPALQADFSPLRTLESHIVLVVCLVFVCLF